MKKSLLTLAFVLCSCMTAFSQATSLTVDCQTPGWLSSKIGYGDQQTVKQLKITGYLNGTDFNFILQLEKDYNLRILDLSEANIVKGGEKILIGIDRDNNLGYSYNVETEIKENNSLPSYIFDTFTNLKKLVTPKSVEKVDGYAIYDYPLYVKVDTLILNGQYKNVNLCVDYTPKSNSGYHGYQIKTLELAEGLDSVSLRRASTTSSYVKWRGMKKLILPSSITKLANLNIEQGNIISKIEHPENITFKNCALNGDTIFIPQGTTERYKNSPFKNMRVIIEMIAPTSIFINQPQLKMYKGDMETLQTTTEPEEVFYKEQIWESSDESIVAVNQNGEITAMNPGTAIVTVSSVKNPDAKAQCEVTVYEHTTGLYISQTEKTLVIGDSFTLNAHTIPEGVTDNEFIWSSSDESIATIDGNGNVAGIQTGTCVITATSVDGGFTATCQVTVIQPVAVTGVTLNHSSLQFDYIGETAFLEATVLPEDAANKNINWTSSNPSVCIVSNGMVVSVGMGTSVVIATTEDGGFMAVCVVTVTSATGLSSVEQDDGMMFQIYDINGLKQKQLQKGINIIQFKDGTKKKVLIK